jgi:ABC-type branched-subunit amino acid transport system ATPase component
MSEIILSIKDLKVNYGGIEAVKGISFDVPKGDIVTLIGANGAGKSSTLRTIAGLVKPKGGTIELRARTSPARIRQRSSKRASPWCLRAGASSRI